MQFMAFEINLISKNKCLVWNQIRKQITHYFSLNRYVPSRLPMSCSLSSSTIVCSPPTLPAVISRLRYSSRRLKRLRAVFGRGRGLGGSSWEGEAFFCFWFLCLFNRLFLVALCSNSICYCSDSSSVSVSSIWSGDLVKFWFLFLLELLLFKSSSKD